ncbi:unnamed protein product [Cochlearia groenlandica]
MEKPTTEKSEAPIKDQPPQQTVDPKVAENTSSVIVLSDESPSQVGIETKSTDHQSPARSVSSGSNLEPAVSSSSVAGSNAPPSESHDASLKETMETVRDVIGRWGRKVGEAAMKAESLAGNTWQHLKTSPSFADAAMGRIAQSTKVLAEGGYEKIFRQTFETEPEEQLQSSYACYLSTSAGPVMGVLYISTEKIAYCSDNPLSYKASGKTEWSYYKVVMPLHQLKSVNPSTNTVNPAEKYIQVISVDDHDFWFMGFLNYEGAVTSLQDTLQAGALQSV